MPANSWLRRYQVALETARLRAHSSDELIACGLTNNVDLVTTLDSETFARLQAGRTIGLDGPRETRADTPDQLVTGIAQYVELGEGFDFPVAGAATQQWLIERIQARTQLGGSGVQAANTLAVLGFRTLAHLTGCSPEQAAAFDEPELIMVPRDGALLPVDLAADPADPTMWHVALEYTAGLEIDVGGRTITAPADSRIIISYDPVNSAFRINESFVESVTAHAGSIRRILIAGYSQITEASDLQSLVQDSLAAFRTWRAARPDLVLHVELGSMSQAGSLADLVDVLGSEVSSIGMNADEFRDLVCGWGFQATRGPVETRTALMEIRNRLSTPRICVHSGALAMTLTSGCSEHERDALLFAALVASTRARIGRFPAFADLDETLGSARLHPLGLSALTQLDASDGVIQLGTDAVVIVPTIDVPKPAATVGLGDSFTAGVLAML